MRKPVLGRGLDRLMQNPPAAEPDKGPDILAPGLRILIRGTEPVSPPTVTTDAAAAAPQTVSPAQPGKPVTSPEIAAMPIVPDQQPADARVAWIPVAGAALLLVDVVLLVWAGIWIAGNSAPTVLQIVGCVASALIACTAGLIGTRLLLK